MFSLAFILKYILIIYIIFVVYKINIELSRGVNEVFFSIAFGYLDHLCN